MRERENTQSQRSNSSDVRPEKAGGRSPSIEEIQHLRWQLQQRSRELSCIYSLSEAVRRDKPLAEIFTDAAALVPAAWEYPELIRARIVFDGRQHAAPPFQPTDWKLSSDIVLAGDARGQLEVYYLQQPPDADDGAFSGEERSFVDAVAGVLAQTAEKKLTEEALWLRSSIIEHIIEGVCALDMQGNIILANKQMAAMHGYEVEELIGKNISVFHTPEQMSGVESGGRQLMETGRFTGEIEHVRRDGSVFPAMMRVSLLRDDSGEPMDVIGTCMDITDRKQAEQDAREQARLNRVLLDSLPCVALLLRPSTREIIACNEAATKAGCVVGETCYGSWPKYEAPCPWCLAPEVWETGEPRELEIEALDAVWDAHWLPLADDLYLHYAFDITERKRAEQELRKRTYDLGERVKELKCLYGISALTEQPDISLAEIAQGVADMIPPSWQYPEITCARVVLNDQEYKTDGFAESPWGQTCEIVAHGETLGSVAVYYLEERPECYEGPFLEEEGDLITAIAERLGRITERKQADEELRAERRHLRALAGELSVAEDMERQRISLALHDNVSQELAAAKIRIGLLAKSMPSTEHAEPLDEVFQMIDRALQDVTSLTFQLCPPVLYRHGLAAALKWLVEEFDSRHDESFEFVGQDISLPLTDEVRGPVFQAVRELLTNVVKHAGADRVTVTVRTGEDEMTITVADDGVGFDTVPAVRPDDETSGFGLFSIRHRIGYFGGRLDIQPAAKGSRITVTMPLVSKDQS